MRFRNLLIVQDGVVPNPVCCFDNHLLSSVHVSAYREQVLPAKTCVQGSLRGGMAAAPLERTVAATKLASLEAVPEHSIIALCRQDRSSPKSRSVQLHSDSRDVVVAFSCKTGEGADSKVSSGFWKRSVYMYIYIYIIPSP